MTTDCAATLETTDCTGADSSNKRPVQEVYGQCQIWKVCLNRPRIPYRGPVTMYIVIVIL